MSKVERFEDLKVWQAAREAVVAIYQISSIGSFSHDYALRVQIRRASASVPSNVVHPVK